MMSKGPIIKNRAPAPIQITAEQILREAQERDLEAVEKKPQQFITDKEELLLYQQTKRKEFEDKLRRQRQSIGLWVQYAEWEATQLDFVRARSIWERALEVDYKQPSLWMKYAEMEMKNKFVNHARNIWERAVKLLPRVDSLWYKYTYMEETLQSIENTREIFEKWMVWQPNDNAWGAFAKFEMRQGDIEKARGVFERYVALWPTARAFIKYAKWEESNYQRVLARAVYERALTDLHSQEKTEKLLVNFARFEERSKEFDRARTIYQYALQQLQQKKQELGIVAVQEDKDVIELKQEFMLFEKRHGDKGEIEVVLLAQKRDQFEKLLIQDRFNYDTWFDYIQLEEGCVDNFDAIRSVYQRAVANVPLLREKRHWKRYIYLWIYYALFEEMVAKSVDHARRVFQDCLKVIPHKLFTFGKIWLLAAKLEVRQKNLEAARKILGHGIGMCGKDNIFKGYIDLELQLGEVDRCRTLYSKYIAFAPHNCLAWIAFAQMEVNFGESSRARAIYDLAIGQDELDAPEMLWKSYIDMETAQMNIENARSLYERLLERTEHVKVWISFGKFEFQHGGGKSEHGLELSPIEVSRSIFAKGYDALKAQGLKEERVLLLESWRDVESSALQENIPGSSRSRLAEIDSKFPKKVKRHRTGEDGSVEDYFDYIFGDDAKENVGLKILEKALAWKNSSNMANWMEEEDSALGKRTLEEVMFEEE